MSLDLWAGAFVDVASAGGAVGEQWELREIYGSEFQADNNCMIRWKVHSSITVVDTEASRLGSITSFVFYSLIQMQFLTASDLHMVPTVGDALSDQPSCVQVLLNLAIDCESILMLESRGVMESYSGFFC